MFQAFCIFYIVYNSWCSCNTAVQYTAVCILVIRADDGQLFLAETCSLNLTAYTVLLTGCNVDWKSLLASKHLGQPC